VRREHVGHVGVEHDVLRRRQHGDRDRHARHRGQIAPRIEQAHRGDRADQADLEHQHPAAAPAEERQPEPIEQRRPRKLERVREPDRRYRRDLVERELLGGEPRLQRLAGEQERQPRRESEQEQRGHPARAEDGEPAHTQRCIHADAEHQISASSRSRREGSCGARCG
jgi:hypothetical protein